MQLHISPLSRKRPKTIKVLKINNQNVFKQLKMLKYNIIYFL